MPLVARSLGLPRVSTDARFPSATTKHPPDLAAHGIALAASLQSSRRLDHLPHYPISVANHDLLILTLKIREASRLNIPLRHFYRAAILHPQITNPAPGAFTTEFLNQSLRRRHIR